MNRFRLFFSSLWGFLQPFVAIFLSKAGPLLASAAVAAVRAVGESMSGSSGSEKRDAAFAAIEADLKRQGVSIGAEVTASMINAAIEAAVQKVKADGR